MSVFKSNNRFGFLNEEHESQQERIKPIHNDSFIEREREYDDRPKYNKFKSYNSAPIVTKKEFEIKAEEFPDLASPVSNNNTTKSFSSLLKKEEPKKEIKEIVEDIVPPGWSYYKYTKFSNGICGDKYSKVTNIIENHISEKNKEIIKKKLAMNEGEEIINALSILHEKRTNKYKELWGEIEWEQMFICPNYDYEYFDKLDQAYELEEEKNNEKYYNDYDDYEDSDNY
jgi:hypothetical protein